MSLNRKRSDLRGTCRFEPKVQDYFFEYRCPKNLSVVIKYMLYVSVYAV